jgi:hypothetical protein
VAVPFPESTSYEEAIQRSLSQGEVSRAKVIEMIGEPDVERSNGSIWIYEQPRHLALGGAITPGGIGGGWLDEYQFMVVEFDGDLVSHVERVEDEMGCTSTGICRPLMPAVGPFPGSYGSSTYSENTVVASKRPDDNSAKTFQSVADMCSWYVYTRDLQANIEIDSNPFVPITDKTYLHILLKPGAHSIKAPSGYEDPFIFEGAELVIECAGGDVVYLEEYIDKRYFGTSRYVIDKVKEDIGQKEILGRHLVISNVVDKFQARQYANTQEISHKPETCALYIYRTGSPLCALLIKVGSLDAFYLEDGTYITSGMLPESLVITAIGSWKDPMVFGESTPREIKLECKAGSSQFVNVEFSTGFMHGCADDSVIDIKNVDENVARDAFKDRIHAPFIGNAE